MSQQEANPKRWPPSVLDPVAQFYTLGSTAQRGFVSRKLMSDLRHSKLYARAQRNTLRLGRAVLSLELHQKVVPLFCILRRKLFGYLASGESGGGRTVPVHHDGLHLRTYLLVAKMFAVCVLKANRWRQCRALPKSR